MRTIADRWDPRARRQRDELGIGHRLLKSTGNIDW
jgi:hypothetical protein